MCRTREENANDLAFEESNKETTISHDQQQCPHCGEALAEFHLCADTQESSV